MLLEKEKTTKTVTVNAAQAQNRPSPLGVRSAQAFGPTVDGWATELACRGIPSPARMGRLPAQEARRYLGRRT